MNNKHEMIKYCLPIATKLSNNFLFWFQVKDKRKSTLTFPIGQSPYILFLIFR